MDQRWQTAQLEIQELRRWAVKREQGGQIAVGANAETRGSKGLSRQASRRSMAWSSNPGRVAGFLYLLLGFSVFRPIYVEGALIVRNNSSATAHNIATHESLFRLGIVCDLL